MFLACYEHTRMCLSTITVSDVGKKCLKYKILSKGNLELLYPENGSKQREGEYGDRRLCLGFSQPHVLEEAAVRRALAAL